MKKSSLVYLIPFLALSVITGCKTAEIQSEKPAASYQEVFYTPPVSVINIPLEMDIKDIEILLNNQLQGLLYEDNSLENNGGDNLMVKAWKKENFKLALENNEISYRIPLKLWLKAGFKVEKFGIELSNYKEIEAAIALKFKTKIEVNKDWTIKTVTVSDGYEWLSAPVLKLGPVDLNIKYVADLILKTNQNTINKEIDDAISNNLNVKKYAQQAWDAIHRPIKISDEYKTWLRITPKEVASMQISGKNGKIRHNICVKAITECFISRQPYNQELVPLPPLTIIKKPQEGFAITLVADIPYTVADSFANVYLKGKTFNSGKKSIIINQLHIYGRNGKLMIETQVSGSIKGNLYFEGIPYFDPSTQALKVKELDYEIKTKNSLLKTADWLAHGTLANLIQDKISFPLAENINQAKLLIQKNLVNNKVAENVLLNGTLGNITVDTIWMDTTSLKTSVQFNGKITLSLIRAVK
ncbi:MAG: DUF4403 family protein [Lentimicrobiaceae bacterium]|nr:DUF4403 family protein [Lentimicrobiaceae bacterium]